MMGAQNYYPNSDQNMIAAEVYQLKFTGKLTTTFKFIYFSPTSFAIMKV
jgi:hypothetical protein